MLTNDQRRVREVGRLINLTGKEVTSYDANGDFYHAHPWDKPLSSRDVDGKTVFIVNSADDGKRFGIPDEDIAVATEPQNGRDDTPVSRLVRPKDNYQIYIRP